MTTQVVILAAGRGRRMFSNLPKVLHPLAGKPLLEHVIHTAMELTDSKPIVVIGHECGQIKNACAHLEVSWVFQEQQKGTGHALQQALPHLKEHQNVLVLYGDVPLISIETLTRVIQKASTSELRILTAFVKDPKGYGRIVRDSDNNVKAIVEENEANSELKKICEINTGIYFTSVKHLKKWLPLLNTKNLQQEYYLTDIIPLALQDGVSIQTIHPGTFEEVLGVNDRVQLNHLERYYQSQTAKNLMQAGVTIYDYNRLDIRGEVLAEKDVTIDVNVILEGKVILEEGCKIGPNVTIRNSRIGKNVEIRANSMLDEADVEENSVVGPFARLRPGSKIKSYAHIGNFVEIKNSTIDAHSKVNHLSYIGDTQIGKRVNIGAGTITCNYDGYKKHQTIIEDDVFIGSGTQLVAPVTIREGSTIGAGSTITTDVPAKKLTLARAKQITIQDWQRPDALCEKEKT